MNTNYECLRTGCSREYLNLQDSSSRRDRRILHDERIQHCAFQEILVSWNLSGTKWPLRVADMTERRRARRKLSSETLKRRGNLIDIGVNGRIVLKFILKWMWSVDVSGSGQGPVASSCKRSYAVSGSVDIAVDLDKVWEYQRRRMLPSPRSLLISASVE